MFSPNRAGKAKARVASSLPAEFEFVAVDAEFVAEAVAEGEDEECSSRASLCDVKVRRLSNDAGIVPAGGLEVDLDVIGRAKDEVAEIVAAGGRINTLGESDSLCWASSLIDDDYVKGGWVSGH